MAELIVTNGDAAATLMRQAGFAADILPWRDVLHDGPVPAVAPRALAAIRARYLTRFSEADCDAIEAELAARDARLEAAAGAERITLWFEHDLYDQLQLVQILARFARRSGINLGLVQAETYLTDYPPETLGALESTRRPVGSAETAYAAGVWADFTASSPERLNARLGLPAPLPHVPAALARLVRELPDSRSGLTLTQQRALSALADGPQKAGRVFVVVFEAEEAKFMSDLSFAAALDDLAFASVPLIEGLPHRLTQASGGYRAYFASEIRLTATGRKILDGAENHVRLNGIDRWLGGTRLTPSSCWAWDETRSAIVRAA